MDTLPSIFASHGSPMIALDPGPTGAFLARLGPAIARCFGAPRAVLAVSAHTLARRPVLLAAARHEAVHDFSGFPDALYRLRYDVLGAPGLAAEVQSLLAQAGIDASVSERGGLDHGIWTALRYLYPDADLPVLPLALVPDMAPAALFALGAALEPLRERGVLVLGTGSITHNLGLVWAQRHGSGDAEPALEAELPECREFRDWFAQRGAARDWEALFDYRRRAPHAVLMHPSDEHLLPWFPAAGAGGGAPLRLHEGVTAASLGMDAYAFGARAPALLAALA